MAAYLIADVDVTAMLLLLKSIGAKCGTERHYGGRYLGRGGDTEVY